MERVRNVSIVVVDDHRRFRQSLISFLRQVPAVEILGEAADGQEAEELALKLSPDVVIMDIKMPRRNGIEAATRIKNQDRSVRVILYSMDEPVISDWSEVKVDRFIPKQRLFEEILPALRPQ
ncbi:MAG: DNA-binding response regulator [Acidobacteria bacterium]|nr:MAG: DNA-binding response regulator [Acidobacteriota bacterium]